MNSQLYKILFDKIPNIGTDEALEELGINRGEIPYEDLLNAKMGLENYDEKKSEENYNEVGAQTLMKNIRLNALKSMAVNDSNDIITELIDIKDKENILIAEIEKKYGQDFDNFLDKLSDIPGMDSNTLTKIKSIKTY